MNDTTAGTPKQSWWQRLKGGLKRTSSSIGTAVADLVTKRKLDSAMLDDIEDVLLRADLGTEVAARISEAVLQAFPDGTSVSRPQGGFVLWIELPGTVDAVQMFRHAAQAGIGMDDAVAHPDRQMQLRRRDAQQQHVASLGPAAAHQRARLVARVPRRRSQRIVVTHGHVHARAAQRHHRYPDAVEPQRRITPLCAEPHADQRARRHRDALSCRAHAPG